MKKFYNLRYRFSCNLTYINHTISAVFLFRVVYMGESSVMLDMLLPVWIYQVEFMRTYNFLVGG